MLTAALSFCLRMTLGTLILLLSQAALPAAAKPDLPPSPADAVALMEIKSHWGPQVDLSSWVPGRKCSSWSYITCYYDRVAKISISAGLTGPIPTVIGNLTYVYQIYADRNLFNGTLPDSLSRLTRLSVLRLGASSSGGFLSGSLPLGFSALTGLTKLYLNNQRLTGSVPPAWAALNLAEINVASNNLSGPIPTVICNWTNLVTMRMGNQRWSGPIPNCISSLTKLTHLYLDNCGPTLNTSLPAELGNLKSLVNLFLNGNSIVGPIPSSFGNLTNLQILFLSGNNITGPLPPTMGNMKSITDWVMEYNQINGSIPESIGNLTSVSRILLDVNRLSGTIPDTIGQLQNLQWLLLQGNMLVGRIPRSVTGLKKLVYFNVANNRLTGIVPSGFVSAALPTAPGQFNLRSNYLSGAPALSLANGTRFCLPAKLINSIGEQVINSNAGNCFSLPSGANCTKPDPEPQRSLTKDCARFCGSHNPLGACAGHGYCVQGRWGPVCLCDSGYKRTKNGLSCK